MTKLEITPPCTEKTAAEATVFESLLLMTFLCSTAARLFKRCHGELRVFLAEYGQKIGSNISDIYTDTCEGRRRRCMLHDNQEARSIVGMLVFSQVHTGHRTRQY